MKPTQEFLFVLLGIFIGLLAAHADNSMDISLHNDDTLDKLNSVSNWTLICEHLCILNLSGPACGPKCPSSVIPIEKPHTSEDFSAEHRSELCQILCDNGLGGSQCLCSVKIIPAASSSQSTKMNRNNICTEFCRLHFVTIRGCKRCEYDGVVKPMKPMKPLKNNNVSYPASPIEPHRMELPTNFPPQPNVPVAPYESLIDPQANPIPPTTPDWNRLCLTLCRQGTGGILCNCDLAPF